MEEFIFLVERRRSTVRVEICQSDMLVWMVSIDTLQFVMQVLLVRFAYPRISSFKKLILLGFVRDWCRCRYLPDCFVSSISRRGLFKLSIVSDVLLSVIYQFHITFHHGLTLELVLSPRIQQLQLPQEMHLMITTC